MHFWRRKILSEDLSVVLKITSSSVGSGVPCCFICRVISFESKSGDFLDVHLSVLLGAEAAK